MIALAYVSKMSVLHNTVEKLFNEMGKNISVAGSITKELYDVNYTLFFRDYNAQIVPFTFDIDTKIVTAATGDDEVERVSLISQIIQYCTSTLTEDPNSRQCVIQPKYIGNDKLAGCISCIHLIERDGFVDLHVLVRSQNFDRNFDFDNLTFCMMMQSAVEVLKSKPGTIHIKVVSLHKIL